MSGPASPQFSWPSLHDHKLDVAAPAIKTSFQTGLGSEGEGIAPADWLIFLPRTVTWSPLAKRKKGLRNGSCLLMLPEWLKVF